MTVNRIKLSLVLIILKVLDILHRNFNIVKFTKNIILTYT